MEKLGIEELNLRSNQNLRRYTSERIEAGDLIGREEGGIGEELLEADGVVVAAVFEKLVEELERREKVVLFQEEVDNAVAQRRSLHVHYSFLLLYSEFSDQKI